MKILTKEEEAEHYNATLKGGITGGFIGLAMVHIYLHSQDLTRTKLTEFLRVAPHSM